MGWAQDKSPARTTQHAAQPKEAWVEGDFHSLAEACRSLAEKDLLKRDSLLGNLCWVSVGLIEDVAADQRVSETMGPYVVHCAEMDRKDCAKEACEGHLVLRQDVEEETAAERTVGVEAVAEAVGR